MNKKIIGIILILLFSLNIVVCAIPDDLWIDDGSYDKIFGEMDSKNNQLDILQKLLIYLEIVNDKIDIERTADFQDFSKAMAKITGISGSDDYIFESLKSSGFIRENYNKNKLKIEDVIFSGIKIIGADRYVKNSDFSLVSIAQQKKLFYNVTYQKNKTITMGEFCQLIYNIISTPCDEIVCFSNDTISYKKATPATILENKFNIIFKRGIITSTRTTDIYGNSENLENDIGFDLELYSTLNYNEVSQYLGQMVVSFIEKNGNEKKKILFCESYKTKILKINDEKINAVDDSLQYENEKNIISKLSVSKDATVIYNGVYYGVFNAKQFCELAYENSSCEFINNNQDNTYDVIFIWNYHHFPVLSNSGKSKRIVFKYNMKLDGDNFIKLDDTVEYSIYKNNILTDISEIKSNDIISIAKSKNKSGRKIIRIIIGVRKVSGEISGAYENSKIFILNNEEYPISLDYKNACGIDSKPTDNDIVPPKIGEKATFYLTFDGKIADIYSKLDYNYGYIIGLYTKDDFEKSAKIKMIEQSGAIKIFDLKEKVIYHDKNNVDGELFEKQIVINKIKQINPNDPRCLISYNVTKNNELSEIFMEINYLDNKTGDLDYPMTLDYDVGSETNTWVYNDILTRYGTGPTHCYKCDSTVPIFMIPSLENADNEDLYSVNKITYKGTDVDVKNLKLYGVNSFYIVKAGVIVGTSGAIIPYKNSLCIIDKVAQAINADGDECTKIYYYQDGIYKNILSSDNDVLSNAIKQWYDNVKISELKNGDIVQFNILETGKVNDFRLLFKNADRGEYRHLDKDGTPINTRPNETFAFWYANAVGIKDDILKINIGINGNIDERALKMSKDVKCYIVDTTSTKVEEASKEDIMQYDIAIREKNLTIYDIVIYKYSN